MKAEIITIGDEILLGQIVDTNSAWIAQVLFAEQIHIQQITSITDKEDHILQALADARDRADLIICTGGLGPTKDDVTKFTAAKFFLTELVHDPAVLAHVEQIFARFNRTMPDINLGQADVLANGEVLFNDWGTAPGMWVEDQGKVFVFLPGVPFEMKNLMTHRVIPKLKVFKSTEQVVNRYILTVGIGESHLAESIADIEDSFPPHVHLAYLPKIGLVRLRISVTGTDIDALNREADQWKEALAKRIGKAVVATEDISFEEVIVRAFSTCGYTLSTAESCTGGNIARLITEIPGSSEMFQGSIVAYANSVKENMLGVQADTLAHHGAVSEQTVIEMAKGVQSKLNSNYAIATSGIAGPGGGTPEKPVGTVWVAVAGRDQVRTKLFQFHQDRLLNIERTTAQALLMLWNLYQEESGF
ncbi:competence/damage-inducible protein A [Sphingobacterium lactis]|uniref:CinA-like protein n=1 Tax=Sphingobacterium lactis TaxID=797291 RepID=A0A1H6AYU5_9SPHI|nr:competence/damage-inducible protein A [Sphingobacterium lactis]SEG53761.1 nicotinamide-nucleotide amidase [Sphingobacterium lactis]